MRKKLVVRIVITLSFILLAVLAARCGIETAAPVATPTLALAPSATAAPDATATVDPAQSPAAGAEAESEATRPPVDASDGISAGEVAAAISSRTPEPTPTPDFVAVQVEEFVAEVGLSSKTFLGLPAEDWIDLTFLLLIVLVGYALAVLGVKLLLALLRLDVRRMPSGFGDAFLESIGSELRWLVDEPATEPQTVPLRLGFELSGDRSDE